MKSQCHTGIKLTPGRVFTYTCKHPLIFNCTRHAEFNTSSFVSVVQLLHGLINQRRMLKLRSSKATKFHLCVQPKGFLCRWSGKLRRRVKTRYKPASVSLMINTTLNNLQVPGFNLSRVQHSRVTSG